MILSHKHKFIFLKTNKTAGTSVEIALSRFCGPDDIIAPISPKDEQKRSGLGYRGAQNYRAPYSDYGLTDWARLLLRGRPLPRFYNHMSAAELLQYIDRRVWDDYFTFCIERNPWDRLISLVLLAVSQGAASHHQRVSGFRCAGDTPAEGARAL